MTVEYTRLDWIRAESARIRDALIRTRDIVAAAKELLSSPAPDTFVGRRTHEGDDIKAEHARGKRHTLTQVSSSHGTWSYGGDCCDKGDTTLSEPSLVLVVDDEYFLLADLEEALTDAGFIVQIASSGEDALTLFSSTTVTYSALVTDVSLRGHVSGWDLARRIREREPAFPIVYVTCVPGEEWASQGVPNSILISRPCERARLIAAVANLLNVGTPPRA